MRLKRANAAKSSPVRSEFCRSQRTGCSLIPFPACITGRFSFQTFALYAPFIHADTSTFCRSDHHANRYYVRRRSLCIGLGLGSKAIPPRLLFAGSSWRCCPMPMYCRLNLALLRKCFWSSRVYPFAGVCVCCPLLCVLIGRRWFRAGLIRCWLF